MCVCISSCCGQTSSTGLGISFLLGVKVPESQAWSVCRGLSVAGQCCQWQVSVVSGRCECVSVWEAYSICVSQLHLLVFIESTCGYIPPKKDKCDRVATVKNI